MYRAIYVIAHIVCIFGVILMPIIYHRDYSVYTETVTPAMTLFYVSFAIWIPLTLIAATGVTTPIIADILPTFETMNEMQTAQRYRAGAFITWLLALSILYVALAMRVYVCAFAMFAAPIPVYLALRNKTPNIIFLANICAFTQVLSIGITFALNDLDFALVVICAVVFQSIGTFSMALRSYVDDIGNRLRKRNRAIALFLMAITMVFMSSTTWIDVKHNYFSFMFTALLAAISYMLK